MRRSYIRSNRKIVRVRVRTLTIIIVMICISLTIDIVTTYSSIKKDHQIEALQKLHLFKDSVYLEAIKTANQRTKQLDTISNNYYLVNKTNLKLINYVRKQTKFKWKENPIQTNSQDEHPNAQN